MAILFSVLWGSVLLPLIFSLPLLFLANKIKQLKFAQIIIGLVPLVGFTVSWLFYFGQPEWTHLSGMDGLLLALPVAGLLYVWGENRFLTQFLLGVLICGVNFFLLKPLLESEPIPWLVINSLSLIILGQVAFVSIVPKGSQKLKQGMENSHDKHLKVFMHLVTYLFVGSLLAFDMMMWGSASWAQTLGGGLFSIFLVLINQSILLLSHKKNKDSLFQIEWLWVFFFWLGLNAFFYLEVPLRFLLTPLLLLLLGNMGSILVGVLNSWCPKKECFSFRGYGFLPLLITLLFMIFVTFGSILWAFLAKPKTFY